MSKKNILRSNVRKKCFKYEEIKKNNKVIYS